MSREANYHKEARSTGRAKKEILICRSLPQLKTWLFIALLDWQHP